jgi:hypothetical protein
MFVIRYDFGMSNRLVRLGILTIPKNENYNINIMTETYFKRSNTFLYKTNIFNTQHVFRGPILALSAPSARIILLPLPLKRPEHLT